MSGGSEHLKRSQASEQAGARHGGRTRQSVSEQWRDGQNSNGIVIMSWLSSSVAVSNGLQRACKKLIHSAMPRGSADLFSYLSLGEAIRDSALFDDDLQDPTIAFLLTGRWRT